MKINADSVHRLCGFDEYLKHVGEYRTKVIRIITDADALGPKLSSAWRGSIQLNTTIEGLSLVPYNSFTEHPEYWLHIELLEGEHYWFVEHDYFSKIR